MPWMSQPRKLSKNIHGVYSTGIIDYVFTFSVFSFFFVWIFSSFFFPRRARIYAYACIHSKSKYKILKATKKNENNPHTQFSRTFEILELYEYFIRFRLFLSVCLCDYDKFHVGEFDIYLTIASVFSLLNISEKGMNSDFQIEYSISFDKIKSF